MSVKTGSCGYYFNPQTGAFSGNRVIFRPAIGERGRITLSNPSGDRGFLAYPYLNSTTLGEIYNGYGTGVGRGDYACVFDYVRKGNGVTVLTYVSGNSESIKVNGDSNGDLYFDARLDDGAFPALPFDPGAPYTNASGLVALSRNPSSDYYYYNSGGADYSSTYTIFNAGWARGSNQFVGDENNV